LRYILILSFHLRLGLPSGFLTSDFPTNTNTDTTSFFSHIRAAGPADLIQFHSTTIIISNI
jgi:hypothetical protein